MISKTVLSCVFFVIIYTDLTKCISVEKDLSLTLQEKNSLDKFRERVTPLLTENFMKTDIYLIRWLRARNFNLNAAENMLRQNLRWRKDNKIDEIVDEDWSDIAKEYPATIDTYDREGRPIGVIDIYEWDIRRAAIQGKGPRLLRYMDYLMESITQQVFQQQAKGLNVTQWKVMGSADGFNLIEHACPLCIPLWIQFINSLENNYNGWLDEFIVLDAPSTINVVLDAVRPFLTRQTSETFRIFSANRAKWLPYLEERIAKDQRRPQYGGTKPPVTY